MLFTLVFAGKKVSRQPSFYGQCSCISVVHFAHLNSLRGNRNCVKARKAKKKLSGETGKEIEAEQRGIDELKEYLCSGASIKRVP